MLTLPNTLPRGVHYGGFYLRTPKGRAVRLWAIAEDGLCIEESMAHSIVELAEEMGRLTALLDASFSADMPLTVPQPIQSQQGQVRPRIRLMKA